MPQQPLNEQFESAKATPNPFDGLYRIAESLRGVGLSQLDIYRIFADRLHQHTEDDLFGDAMADVLDCIWGGGWGKLAPELFDDPLTSERIGIVSVDIDTPTVESDNWEMVIEHPHIYLRFEIDGPQIVHGFLAFLRKHLNSSEFAELRLGTFGFGSASVSIIKDDEFPNRFFLCVLSGDGAVRYTLNVNELGDYIGALLRAAEGLPHSL